MSSAAASRWPAWHAVSAITCSMTYLRSVTMAARSPHHGSCSRGGAPRGRGVDNRVGVLASHDAPEPVVLVGQAIQDAGHVLPLLLKKTSQNILFYVQIRHGAHNNSK
jgi:hypothetical protein